MSDINLFRGILAASLPVFVLGSCTVHPDEYDAPAPYQGGVNEDEPSGVANSIYDSPAAYGDGAPPGIPALAPGLPADPGDGPLREAPLAPDPPVSVRSSEAVVHTVVAGDTLSGISSRYGVSMDAIRRANGMTGDVVVLGRRLVIPAR